VAKEKEHPHPEYAPDIKTDREKAGGINQKLDSINDKLEQIAGPKEKKQLKKSLKMVKLPWGIKSKLKKLATKGKVLVILLKTNKDIQPIVTDIKDGFISIDGIPHNCSMDFVFLWKGKYPCIVLPEWDLNPIGTKDYYKAVEDKRVATPVAVIMRMIKSGENLIDNKTKTKPVVWVIVGLVVIALLYTLFS